MACRAGKHPARRLSRRSGVDGTDSDEVVGGCFEFEPGPVPFLADVADLASSTDSLDPTERFLDSFADPLGDPMPGMAGGAPINR